MFLFDNYFTFLFISFLFIFDEIRSCVGINGCEDWITYNNEKCFKILNRSGTKDEAEAECRKLEESSGLITIHSKDEQIFLNNMFSKYSDQNVWLAIEYKNKAYKWSDNSPFNYTNWIDSKSNGIPCVWMTLSKTQVGKWSAQECSKKALMACQKKQVMSGSALQAMIEKLDNRIMELEKRVIPEGFIYVQFPKHQSPEELWPNSKWDDVTNIYADLFFRAEGTHAKSFGEVQEEDYPGITKYLVQCTHFDHGTSQSDQLAYNISKGHWTTTGCRANTAIDLVQIYREDGEVRPKNMAIRIWKRVSKK